jgi:hypothetical protein
LATQLAELRRRLPIGVEHIVEVVGVDLPVDARELPEKVGDQLVVVADRAVLHLRYGMEPSCELAFIVIEGVGVRGAGEDCYGA